MRVTFLGTGTPTNPGRNQSGLAVEVAGKLLLFDAGRGTVRQLAKSGLPIGKVNPFFLTHLHVDHISELFDVIIGSAFEGREGQLLIVGPAGTQKIVRALLDIVYAPDIRFRLEEDRDIRRRGGSWNERPEAILDVEVIEVESGLAFEADGLRVTTAPVVHGYFPDAPDFEWRCLGYRIEAEGKVLAISGDTVRCDGLMALAAGADLLVQCCHMPKRAVKTPVMRYLAEHILPSSGDVGGIATDAGVKHMALTHLSASINVDSYDEIRRDVAQTFAGRVTIAEDGLVVVV